MIELDPIPGISLALGCFGVVYLGAVGASYYARKKEIIQKMGFGVPIRPDYSLRDKIEDIIFIGPYLAEKRFKNGKFDERFPDIDKETLTAYKQSL